MDIGRRINIYRKKNNLRLNDIAGAAVSAAHLSKIENGYRKPGAATLSAISAALQLPLPFFKGFEKEDIEVQHVLTQLEQFIITDISKAAPLIETLEENYYYYLSNVSQEVYYLLLKCAYYCKSKQYPEALRTYETLVQPFVEGKHLEKAPAYVQNAYHYCQGMRHYQSSDFTTSLRHYKQFRLDGQPLSVKAAITYNIAVLSSAIKDYQQAEEFSQLAIKYYESLSQRDEVSMVYNLIGVIYLNQEKFDQAMEALSEAEARLIELNSQGLLTQVFHNKGIVMRKAGKQEAACDYLEKSLELKEQEGLVAQKQITYHSLCKTYLTLDRLEDAKQLFHQAKDEVTQTLDHYYLLEAFLDYYEKTNDLDTYQKSIEKCIHFFKQNHDQEPLDTLYLKLADHLYKTGRYKRAADCYLAHIKQMESQ
ncbi:helix-turn-helix domain-containing protein [Halobacillus sp. Marseille-Q1614]|uniref:helix-turn-helix domain-containing protein n=1 Tax=Halobacillus sp. Marseille-Q1614 TaxID=2709134 RepID=UPI00157072D4|nr:helix-turn-helix domain-containing protein [Halobacillus sp. Marseille-Q1614]